MSYAYVGGLGKEPITVHLYNIGSALGESFWNASLVYN